MNLPSELIGWLGQLKPIFHASSFETFMILMAGFMYGRASNSVVQAAQYAPPEYNWRRLHTFLSRARWSGPSLSQGLVRAVVASLYGATRPARLVWAVDLTAREKASAKKIPGIAKTRRPARRRGQSRTLWGHRYIVVGLLHQASDRWRALLVNVLLQWGRRTVTEQMKRAMAVVTVISDVIHVFSGDRGLGSTRFLLVTRALNSHAVVRVKRNFVVYETPPPPSKKRRGRPRQYGRAYHMTKLPLRRMTKTRHPVVIGGRPYVATLWRGRFLRRGFGPVEIVEVRWGRHHRLWLCATDPTMSTEEILAAFDGRKAIETAIQEAKSLGLGQYRGRRMAGVRRHPLVVCVTHSLLSLLALGLFSVKLPKLLCPWYSKQDTVGQTQRRLLKWKEEHAQFQASSHSAQPLRKAA